MGTGSGEGLNFGNSYGSNKEKQVLDSINGVISESPTNEINEDFLQDENNFINILKENNVKFSEQDIVFITKDSSGKIVWLENGNKGSGLEHILDRHADDFKSKHNIEKDKIADHLKKIYAHGKIEYERIKITNNKEGYERLLSYNNQYYILSGMGTNGYIVSAYPIDKTVADKLKRRYGK